MQTDEKVLLKSIFPIDYCAFSLYNGTKLYQGEKSVGELYAIVSGKGGTGKTSV